MSTLEIVPFLLECSRHLSARCSDSLADSHGDVSCNTAFTSEWPPLLLLVLVVIPKIFIIDLKTVVESYTVGDKLTA
jgi:hypothetical protein